MLGLVMALVVRPVMVVGVAAFVREVKTGVIFMEVVHVVGVAEADSTCTALVVVFVVDGTEIYMHIIMY